MARIVIDYGDGGTVEHEVDHRDAIGVMFGGNAATVAWHGLVGAKSVKVVHDKGEKQITAPPFVDGVSAGRDTFAANRRSVEAE